MTSFGRYQLLELLGRGGMGEVWRARDTAIDRDVALKMLLPHYAQDRTFEHRFRREARAAARLEEAHVVPIYDIGEIDGRLYVTMRLIRGHDLQELVDRGPLATERTIAIVTQVASALDAAHEVGLVHRDVKPSNVLLAKDDFAYLIDFGIARAAGETALTSAGITVGTWAYMAPERFSGGEIDPATDVYALACVLYQCLTGELPFPRSTLEQIVMAHLMAPPPRPRELRPELSQLMDEVIAIGMAKDPGQRYRTTGELAAAARDALAVSDGRLGHSTLPSAAPLASPMNVADTQYATPALPVVDDGETHPAATAYASQWQIPAALSPPEPDGTDEAPPPPRLDELDGRSEDADEASTLDETADPEEPSPPSELETDHPLTVDDAERATDEPVLTYTSSPAPAAPDDNAPSTSSAIDADQIDEVPVDADEPSPPSEELAQSLAEVTPVPETPTPPGELETAGSPADGAAEPATDESIPTDIPKPTPAAEPEQSHGDEAAITAEPDKSAERPEQPLPKTLWEGGSPTTLVDQTNHDATDVDTVDDAEPATEASDEFDQPSPKSRRSSRAMALTAIAAAGFLALLVAVILWSTRQGSDPDTTGNVVPTPSTSPPTVATTASPPTTTTTAAEQIPPPPTSVSIPPPPVPTPAPVVVPPAVPESPATTQFSQPPSAPTTVPTTTGPPTTTSSSSRPRLQTGVVRTPFGQTPTETCYREDKKVDCGYLSNVGG